MPSEHPILVVEPSEMLAEEIATHLRLDGHRVAVASTGGGALAMLEREGVALVLSEVALPDLDGAELLRRVRRDPRRKEVPVVLASERGDEIDRVVAFELGADDYIVKPFSLRELALRIRAILRRARPGLRDRTPDVLVVGPVRLDVSRHQATVDGRAIALTPLEFRLLSHLASRPGRVHTREALLERVWHQPGEAVTRAVDTSIKRLRRKLGPAGDWIETVRGVGYRLRDGQRAAARERCG